MLRSPYFLWESGTARRISTEELGMDFINNYNGLENHLVALLLIQVLFKLEQIYIRLVICFPHSRLLSLLNIEKICCTVPHSLQLQAVYTSGYITYILLIINASFSWIKGCRASNTAMPVKVKRIYRGAGISIIGGADIHIFVFTDCKNNWFQNKLIGQNTNIW
jgi:hypothetical protein